MWQRDHANAVIHESESVGRPLLGRRSVLETVTREAVVHQTVRPYRDENEMVPNDTSELP